MRLSLLAVTGIILLFSCNDHSNNPDTSEIKVDLKTQRFEQDFFKMDTTRLSQETDRLMAAYPSFGENFFGTILNADPRWQGDTLNSYIKGFIGSYRNVYDSAQKLFADFSPYEEEIRGGLQKVKYYFPAYKAPTKVITYIGPMDGYGDILDVDAFLVGLQHHLGKGSSMYQAIWVQETYPAYISNRFEPAYIAVNCMKNIVLDMFPEKNEDKSLLVQMVEKGRRLYMLSRLLPAKKEYQLIGYTEQQLADSYAHEAAIWDLFVQNNFLQTIDNNVIKNYIGESPKTQELGEASPGNIGSFAGWQIVKKYMAANSKTTLPQLMQLDPEMIVKGAKYKP